MTAFKLYGRIRKSLSTFVFDVFSKQYVCIVLGERLARVYNLRT